MRDAIRAVADGAAIGAAWAAAGIVGWTFAGYPVLAWAHAGTRGRPVASDPLHLPTVSVVIPAYNEAGIVADKVSSVLAATYPPERLEVVVVDDGSVDGTGDVVARCADPRVRLLRQPERQGKASAVNRGVDAATGDIVVLSDATALFDADALRQAAPLFADPHVGVVVGSIRVLDDRTGVARPAGLYWRLQEHLARWESASGSTVGVNGNFFALRRTTFEPLPPDVINDEFTIALRQAAAGRRIVCGRGVVTYDRAAPSMGGEYARRARINAGRMQWARSTAGRHPLRFRVVSHKLLRSAVPPAFAVLLGATGLRAARTRSGSPADRSSAASWLVDLALLRGRGAQVGLATQLLWWGVGAMGVVLEAATGRTPRPLRVPAYLASTTLAGLAGLSRHVTRGQTVLWSTGDRTARPQPDDGHRPQPVDARHRRREVPRESAATGSKGRA